jgi:hypothetical protein
MENQIVKTENRITALKNEPKNLTGCLLNATESGDQQLVKTLVNTFLGPAGTDYFSLLRISQSERIPALAKENRLYVHKIISAQIEYTMKFFNVATGLSIEQVFLLADQIIDESEEDNLSLQDVFVFLQKLGTGQMGVVYNRLDIPSIMELLESHRQERHKQYQKAKEEIHIQQKAYGPSERESDNRDRERELMREAIGEQLKAKYKDA